MAEPPKLDAQGALQYDLLPLSYPDLLPVLLKHYDQIQKMCPVLDAPFPFSFFQFGVSLSNHMSTTQDKKITA
ncbi:MAG: hypothetical protein C4520_10340 [Candidatus Abyssobacteria bacterium SURF_5]|uniref:Uncharacterized protein n=1 Tax=Abyssobacteria bacterium (strain SURF_5) TaxID=2093360 RepID=A0A3A4NZU2_ABYX5|nr:MAG: hypothetical protein C4520_10340 [Candidatus Abyssubacteria bacterium SURF_5]